MALVLLIVAHLLTVSVLAREFPNCQSGPLASNQVCNKTLDPWSRATALVQQFTRDEKFANSWDNSPGVSRLGLPAYEWWQEALHGVARSRGVSFANSGPFSYATSFPCPVSMGAAFDMPLIRSVADTVGREARAFANAGRCGLNFWTPNINPLRDPRWGRGLEVPSEDPYVVEQYVRELVPGLQGGVDGHRLVATCKHFAGYDLENWKGNRRYGFNAVISRRDLQDYYLAPFRACVRDANAQSVMCSYNAVNGIPTCADPWLLQDVLRTQYGFNTPPDRWVTADCDSLANVWQDHRHGSSAADAAARSLNAGTDLDCGDFWPRNLPAAYNARLINDSVLDRSLIRRYASMARLGWFDDAAGQPDRQIGWEAVGTPEARALALRAAVEGIVLLRNEGGVLPLGGGTSSVRRVAVVGPLASATTQMQGNYYGIAQNISTVVSAFQATGYTVTTAQGCDINSYNTNGFAAALSAARNADAVVYVGGLDTSVEAEDRDREQITWPGQQLSLIRQLAAATTSSGNAKKPFVVVQMGTMVDSSALVAEGSGVDALLWAGYPGQDGGRAVVAVITGDEAPAGRLPVTQYPAAYVNDVPMTDMNLAPGTGNPGRTYKWYTKTPVFQFGHGLHYTTFNVTFAPTAEIPLPSTFTTASLTSNLPLSPAQAGPPGSGNYPDLAPFVTLPVDVVNTGNVTSDYVVLAFVRGEYGPEPRPARCLVAFARVHDVETAARAELQVTLGSVARSDDEGNLVLWPGRYSVVLDVEERDVWEFEITGEAVVLERLAPKR